MLAQSTCAPRPSKIRFVRRRALSLLLIPAALVPIAVHLDSPTRAPAVPHSAARMAMIGRARALILGSGASAVVEPIADVRAVIVTAWRPGTMLSIPLSGWRDVEHGDLGGAIDGAAGEVARR